MPPPSTPSPAPQRDSLSNSRLESVLSELKETLEPVQQSINKAYSTPQWPVGLILGPPRSGTTLFLQILASSGGFGCPTNLLTRFAYAPYIGAHIQNLLLDPEYDPEGVFQPLQIPPEHTSTLGKTKGPGGVNEFFHFWRRFYHTTYPRPLSKTELAAVPHDVIAAELASIESALQRPLVMKGLMQQYNLPEVFDQLPHLFFFRLTRKPEDIMKSILLARERYSGNREEWWSVQPAEYEKLITQDVYHQIAGQVYFTEQAILRGLERIPSARQMTVDYEDICEDPNLVVNTICRSYSPLNCSIEIARSPKPQMRPRTRAREISAEDTAQLKAAYTELQEAGA